MCLFLCQYHTVLITSAISKSLKKKKKDYFYFLAVVGLCCCTWAFSSYREQGLLFTGVWASHYDGFCCCRAQALGVQTSVAVARGLSSRGTQA